MRAFAELLDRLSLTASRNAKLVLLRDYLKATPDPDRGWALAALTGDLIFDAAKPAMIRKAVEARVDSVLFGWSYDYVGDLAETVAVKRCFGDHARKLVVNSTKSMTGHLLGAAGGVEAVFSTLALYHQISPPTINIFNQDADCDLDYCANSARNMEIRGALSNSFGFGGTNGTLALRRM